MSELPGKRCLSVSSEPISGSCARYRRVLQKYWRPCQLFMGIMLFKKEMCVTGTTTSKVDKNCWKTSLIVRKLQLLWMQKQFQRWWWWWWWCVLTSKKPSMRLWMQWVICISKGNSDRRTTDKIGWDKMGPASQQCPKSHGYDRAAILGRNSNNTHATANVLATSCTWWLLALPQYKMGLLG